MSTPNRLREATTRTGMRQVNVWLPASVHRALNLVRAQDGIAVGEIVRQAVKLWLERRKAARRKKP